VITDFKKLAPHSCEGPPGGSNPGIFTAPHPPGTDRRGPTRPHCTIIKAGGPIRRPRNYLLTFDVPGNRKRNQRAGRQQGKIDEGFFLKIAGLSCNLVQTTPEIHIGPPCAPNLPIPHNVQGSRPMLAVPADRVFFVLPGFQAIFPFTKLILWLLPSGLRYGPPP